MPQKMYIGEFSTETEKLYLVLAMAINLNAEQLAEMFAQKHEPKGLDDVYNESIELWEEMRTLIQEKL